jgi:hypothetical protein
MPVYTDEAIRAYRERELGRARNGEVGIRDFDLAMVRQFKGEYHEVGPDKIPGYYAQVDGVEPAPGLPGIQVVFGNPDDAFVNYLLPLFVVTRDDISPAMSRWHPHTIKYRVPKAGAQLIQVTGPGGTTLSGYKDMVQQDVPTPYDISYTLTVAHERRGLKARETGLKMLHHALKWFQPYFNIVVIDSINDQRIYFGTAEAATSADELADVADRLISWTMSVTVEALIDVLDEKDVTMATGRTFNYSQTP